VVRQRRARVCERLVGGPRRWVRRPGEARDDGLLFWGTGGKAFAECREDRVQCSEWVQELADHIYAVLDKYASVSESGATEPNRASLECDVTDGKATLEQASAPRTTAPL